MAAAAPYSMSSGWATTARPRVQSSGSGSSSGMSGAPRPVLFEDDAGQLLRGHQRVGRADPLLELVPVAVGIDGDADPAVTAEPVPGRLGAPIGRDDGGGLLLRELDAHPGGLR